MTTLDSPLTVGRRWASRVSIVARRGLGYLTHQSRAKSSPTAQIGIVLVGLVLFLLALGLLVGLVFELVGLYTVLYVLFEGLSRLVGPFEAYRRYSSACRRRRSLRASTAAQD